MPAFLRCRGNNREGLIPPSPATSSPTRHTSGRERSSSIRVVIFFTSFTTPHRPFVTPRALASAFVALDSNTARGEARWGAYPNEILLWRVSLESAEVRLRLGRALKDVRRDAALFQRFA